jgi:hypothetical protein
MLEGASCVVCDESVHEVWYGRIRVIQSREEACEIVCICFSTARNFSMEMGGRKAMGLGVWID